LIVVSKSTPDKGPTVTSISPNRGSTAGGTIVTITGINFLGATSVSFGSTAATSFTVNSSTQITAVSPPGSSTVDVTVTTPGGTSATSSADLFTYICSFSSPPTVSNINPSNGPATGGTSISITGTCFGGDAYYVSFGSTNTDNFTIDSDTQITVISPAGSGTVDVTVSTPNGTSATSAADQFVYNGPTAATVTNVSPTTGSTDGGTIVIITGTGFTGATAVSFGSTAATRFTVDSDSQITAISPSVKSEGIVDVIVTTPGGTSATSGADQFTYFLPPPIP